MELKDKIINFLGDSITEGHGTSGEQAHFTNLIKEKYGLKKANNYGIGGTRLARQYVPTSEKHDKDFCGRCTQMDPDADVIVVFGGTNDFGHGDAPLGSFEDRTSDTFYGACHYLMRTLLETYPSAVIVICTPLHRISENDLRTGRPPEDTAPLSRYVEILREVADFYSLPLLDLWKCSGLQPDVPRIRELYMPDGLHPNDAGHRLLCDRIGEFLLSL